MIARPPLPPDPRLQLVPASGSSRLWLWLIAFVLPVALSMVLPRFGHGPSYATHWVAESLRAQRWLERWIGTGMVALLTGGVCVVLDCLLHRHRLRIDDDGIDVATTLFKRRLSWPELDLAAARVTEMDEHPQFKPMLKSNGYALPGFRSGWFRSRDFSRLFMATSGGTRLLRIPTRLGYTLLLQPGDPNAVLARLRELSDRSGSGVQRGGRSR